MQLPLMLMKVIFEKQMKETDISEYIIRMMKCFIGGLIHEWKYKCSRVS